MIFPALCVASRVEVLLFLPTTVFLLMAVLLPSPTLSTCCSYRCGILHTKRQTGAGCTTAKATTLVLLGLDRLSVDDGGLGGYAGRNSGRRIRTVPF